MNHNRTKPGKYAPTPTAMHLEEYRVPLGAGHYHVVGTTTHEIGYFSRRADAAHIVHCVNSHDQLVAALKMVESCLAPGDNDITAQTVRKALAAAEKGA